VDSRRLAGRLNLVGPWLRRSFGGPVVKAPLDAGRSCPNRDGTLGTGGCLFCPPSGSGPAAAGRPVARQLAEALERRLASGRPARVLAYYQAFSATHAGADQLARDLEPALRLPAAGIIVATRPDCLGPARWRALAAAARAKPLWLELGLQSAHEGTLAALGRGHGVAAFDRAVRRAADYGIRVVAHVILGLPGEEPAHTEATARHLAGLSVWGVKLHNLMVLAGSRLAAEHAAGRFNPWPRAKWAAAAAGFVARLPRETLIHRLAADPGRDRLVAPEWAGDKAANLAALAAELERRELRQGELCRQR
jgi:radical SAM protein (TIGR01212 family)